MFKFNENPQVFDVKLSWLQKIFTNKDILNFFVSQYRNIQNCITIKNGKNKFLAVPRLTFVHSVRAEN